MKFSVTSQQNKTKQNAILATKSKLENCHTLMNKGIYSLIKYNVYVSVYFNFSPMLTSPYYL